jgi:hypothetical protein
VEPNQLSPAVHAPLQDVVEVDARPARLIAARGRLGWRLGTSVPLAPYREKQETEKPERDERTEFPGAT